MKNHHLAAVRDFEPEAPQPRALLLVGARAGDGIELEAAGIEPLRQGGDSSAFARCVPALKDHDGGHIVVPARFFQVVEPRLQPRQHQFEFFPRELFLRLMFSSMGNARFYKEVIGCPGNLHCAVATFGPRQES